MLGTPPLTYRRFGVLLRQLPRDSAYVLEVGGPAAAWSRLDYLVASVIDELRIHDWHWVSAHSTSKPPQPTLVRRPSVTGEQQAKPKRTLAEMRARLADPRWVPADQAPQEVINGRN